MQTKFYEQVNEEEGNYFARLSNWDRKRWIASEHYNRQHYGIQ